MYLFNRTFIKFGILLNLIKYCDKPGADPDIFKREGGDGGVVLSQPPWLTGEENFRFQMV